MIPIFQAQKPKGKNKLFNLEVSDTFIEEPVLVNVQPAILIPQKHNPGDLFIYDKNKGKYTLSCDQPEKQEESQKIEHQIKEKKRILGNNLLIIDNKKYDSQNAKIPIDSEEPTGKKRTLDLLVAEQFKPNILKRTGMAAGLTLGIITGWGCPSPSPTPTTFYIAVTNHMSGEVYQTIPIEGFTNSNISVNYNQLAGGITDLAANYFVVRDGGPTATRLGLAVNNPGNISINTKDNNQLKAYVLESGAPYYAISLGGEVGVPQNDTGKRMNFDGQTPNNEYEQEVFQNTFNQINNALRNQGFDTGYRINGSIGGGNAFVYGCADCDGNAGAHSTYQGFERTILVNTRYGLTLTGMKNVCIAEAVERFTLSNNPGNIDLGSGGIITSAAVKLVRAKALFAPT